MEMLSETALKWLVTFVLGTGIGFVSSQLKKEKEKNQAIQDKNKTIENAVQSLLRDRLIDKYRHYKAVGEMTILDKENIDHLYNEYVNLGGNGTVKELFEDLHNIEIKVIKE